MSPAETSADSTDSSRSRWLWRAVRILTGVLVACWLLTCVIFVDETEVVIVERLGRIVSVRDAGGGLEFKAPWPIGTVRRFDKRLQLFDPPGREMFTRDKKNVVVDAYICWRIADAPATSESHLERPAVRFFRSLGTLQAAQSHLETRVRSSLATRIAQAELSDLLRVTDPESPPEANPKISLDSIAADLLKDVRQRAEDAEPIEQQLGIEVVDVRIKRINFPLGNQQSVFERMKSERQKIADRYRSAGLAESTVIRSHADRQHNEVMTKANAEAERIRGEAEAESLAILNRSHAKDPEFYALLQTLDAYKKVLNERTTLVLSASSNLFKLLVEGVPQAATQAMDEGANAKQPDPAKPVEGAKQ